MSGRFHVEKSFRKHCLSTRAQRVEDLCAATRSVRRAGDPLSRYRNADDRIEIAAVCAGAVRRQNGGRLPEPICCSLHEDAIASASEGKPNRLMDLSPPEQCYSEPVIQQPVIHIIGGGHSLALSELMHFLAFILNCMTHNNPPIDINNYRY